MATTDEQARDVTHQQREVMCRVLANTVVKQLVESGCDSGQLIDFAGEVLRCITDRGFEGSAGEPGGQSAPPVGSQAVEFRVEAGGSDGLVIRGTRVALRPATRADRPLLEAWSTERDIRQTFSKEHLAGILARLSGPADPEGDLPLLLCDEQGKGMGLFCLLGIDEQVGQAEMTKLVGDPAARGKGYAAEATKVVLAYAFDQLGLRRVYLKTSGANFHNIRLNEAVGFKFEGILRQSHLLAGKLVDVATMSILAHEYFRLYHLKKD